MIFIGGDGAFVVVLVFLFFFVVLPILLFRRVGRAVTSSGWQVQQVPPSPWQAPQQPVLPEVVPAEVASLRDRLAHDIRSLDPGADPVSRQAMADASERHATATTLLERASSDAQLRTAWLASVEGLSATRVVRQRLGLDPGPPIPTLPPQGPVLTGPARLDVDGRPVSGAPTYAPGHPHWFPGGSYGGRHVPGGWYDVPFWPSALLLGGLGGWALGGLAAGAMYGDDLGYGGDWGGGSDWDAGGGDWGAGGGDWGGGGGWDSGGAEWGGGGGWDAGGGDWGGGGGDFGGGGDGGGW